MLLPVLHKTVFKFKGLLPLGSSLYPPSWLSRLGQLTDQISIVQSIWQPRYIEPQKGGLDCSHRKPSYKFDILNIMCTMSYL